MHANAGAHQSVVMHHGGQKHRTHYATLGTLRLVQEKTTPVVCFHLYSIMLIPMRGC